MKLTKPSELANVASSPSTWVVNHLLRTNRKRVSLLCGSPHAGKSTIARQLAIAVAHGQSFLGRETVQGKVLYWQSEETLEDAKDDFTRSGMLPTDDARLVIMHPESGDKHLTDLAKVLDEDREIRLVIIETLDDFLQMDDLSDNPSARRAFEKFDELVVSKYEHRCCFVVLHHFKKSDEQHGLNLNRILGATVIAGKTDAKIYIKQVSDINSRRYIQVQTRKGIPIEPTYLEFNEKTQTSVLGVTLADEAANSRKATITVGTIDLRSRVLNEIANNTGQSKRSIVAKVGGKSANIYRTISDLIIEGTVQVVKHGRSDCLHVKTAGKQECQCGKPDCWACCHRQQTANAAAEAQSVTNA